MDVVGSQQRRNGDLSLSLSPSLSLSACPTIGLSLWQGARTEKRPTQPTNRNADKLFIKFRETERYKRCPARRIVFSGKNRGYFSAIKGGGGGEDG